MHICIYTGTPTEKEIVVSGKIYCENGEKCLRGTTSFSCNCIKTGLSNKIKVNMGKWNSGNQLLRILSLKYDCRIIIE